MYGYVMTALFGWLAMLCLGWTAISFMSPALGEDADAGLWRWVYALGAVAFGLLTAYLMPL